MRYRNACVGALVLSMVTACDAIVGLGNVPDIELNQKEGGAGDADGGAAVGLEGAAGADASADGCDGQRDAPMTDDTLSTDDATGSDAYGLVAESQASRDDGYASVDPEGGRDGDATMFVPVAALEADAAADVRGDDTSDVALEPALEAQAGNDGSPDATADQTFSPIGPFEWTGSSWPRPTQLDSANDQYCWLSGFSLGYRGANSPDKAYVYIGSDGYWYLSGSGRSVSDAPSPSSWGQAYCIGYQSPQLFSPWGGYASVACAPSSDAVMQGSCYSSANGSTAPVTTNNTWTQSMTTPDWTNTFCALQGLAYDGNDVASLQPQVGPMGGYPSTFQDVQIQAGVNNGAQSTMQVGWGCLWPENNADWFCVGGEGCSVTYGTANSDAGTSTSLGSASDRICQMQALGLPSGQDGPIGAKVWVDASNTWQLSVSGPNGANTSAAALCVPLPYKMN